MEKETFQVEIRGIRPYLMSAFHPPEKNKRLGANPTVEEDCENQLYRTEDKTIFVPSLQVWASMRDAAKRFPYHGREKCTNAVKASVFIEPDRLFIEPQTFTPFVSAVRIPPRTGARVMKGRPQFEKWCLKFNLINTDEVLKAATLKDILKEAGERHGIGDWRPRFGTFEIASWSRA